MTLYLFTYQHVHGTLHSITKKEQRHDFFISIFTKQSSLTYGWKDLDLEAETEELHVMKRER
jgi:hypothetical protein